MTIVADFQIKYTQYINEDGKAIHQLPHFAQNLDKLVELYRLMVLVRTFDTKAIALQRTGRMGTYASTLGQEAVSAGIGSAMEKNDVLVPYYRDYAAQLQRGVKMSELYQYWGGDERGNCYKNNQHDLPISVPIGSQSLHAAGIAKAFQYRKQKHVVVTTTGDGGSSTGDFYEAINVAGVWQLPIVFVINNNQWAISVPLSKQTHAQTLAQKAIAAGIPGEQVDGNDVVAVGDVVSRAIEKARKGDGPSVIEALCYRLSDHTTADDARRYRPESEFEKAKKQDPVLRLRQYLYQQNVWDEQKQQQLLQACTTRVNESVDEYLSIKKQPIESMFDYHYAELPKAMIEQRQQAIEDAEDITHG